MYAARGQSFGIEQSLQEYRICSRGGPLGPHIWPEAEDSLVRGWA